MADLQTKAFEREYASLAMISEGPIMLAILYKYAYATESPKEWGVAFVKEARAVLARIMPERYLQA